jgi:2-polyprenyl-6-methoxyphenol hydroxylase-like FAD-dependent oxidoreductase/sugar lactone lactonase YvrE
MSHTMTEVDVVIVGYGPGGQTLAALLARKGFKVVALERYPALFNLARAGHVDHETLRIVQSVTDPRDYLAKLWEVRGDYVWLNGRGETIMLQPEHDTTDSALSGYYSDFSQWQPDLEATLDRAAREAGAEIRMGWEATALRQTATGVEVDIAQTEASDRGLNRTGATDTLRSRYLVGMDGANSFVRRALDIAREDLNFDERWLVCDMETLQPTAFTPNIGQICDPARPRMLMPLGHKHRRFEWMVLPHESTEEMERSETSWRLLEEFGVTPTNHRIARNVVYRFQARIAERWREGRILLAGDAAHTMPPFAGQGMLSSLRDANNLAWKLGLVLRGDAPDALLDSYELERRAHVRAWTEVSLAEGRISCELDPQKAAERDARLTGGEKLPAPHPPHIEDGIVPGADSCYAHPLAGTLGLQARVKLGERQGLFDDVFGPSRFSIVSIGGAPADVLTRDQLQRLEKLGAILLEALPMEATARPGGFHDLDGRCASYFRANRAAAVINRPDFNVFGAVRRLEDLPGLVDALFDKLDARAVAQVEPQPFAAGLRYVEAPRWRDGYLWFSDVHDYKLKRANAQGVVEDVCAVSGRPSGLGFLADGRLLMATALDRKLWIVEGGTMREVADLSSLATGFLNDMVVDGAGRAFVGDTGFRLGKEAPRPGRLIGWREGSPARILAEGLDFPNGCAVTPDGRRLFLAETFGKRITSFEIANDGSLSNRKTFAELDWPPDGLCLDEELGLWVGLPEAQRFVRLDASGRLDRAIAGPAPFAVAPAFGGPDRRRLFLASADTDLARLSRGETSARIDFVDLDIGGAGYP